MTCRLIPNGGNGQGHVEHVFMDFIVPSRAWIPKVGKPWPALQGPISTEEDGLRLGAMGCFAQMALQLRDSWPAKTVDRLPSLWEEV